MWGRRACSARQKPSNAQAASSNAARSSAQTSAIVPGKCALRCLPPQVLAMLFQPCIQSRRSGKSGICCHKRVGHPEHSSRICPFSQPAAVITELGRKQRSGRHRLEADIDLTLFAAADAIDCGAHVVIKYHAQARRQRPGSRASERNSNASRGFAAGRL